MRRRPAHFPVSPLFVLAVLVMIAAVTGTVLTGIFPALFVVAGFVLVGRQRAYRRLHARHHVHSWPLERPQPARPNPAPWAQARARFARLAEDYAAYECDPLAVLQMPALADVEVPATARFVDAFAEAQALNTDQEPPGEHRDRFIAAVDRASRAWNAARDVAERMRDSGIPEQERSAVARTIKLLTVARDSTHDAERLAAYAKARSELARLERTGAIRFPRRAAAALDAAARTSLPES